MLKHYIYHIVFTSSFAAKWKFIHVNHYMNCYNQMIHYKEPVIYWFEFMHSCPCEPFYFYM